MSAVFGLEVEDMPANWSPLESVTVLACLDDDGQPALLIRRTESLKPWDCVGMLTVALDMEREAVQELFEPEDDDESGGL